MDNSRLFDGLDVAGTTNYRKHLNTHNVIFIDFSHVPDDCGTYEDYIGGIRASLQEAYPFLGQRQFGSTMILLAGISYDEEKHHKCRIERVVLPD